MKCLAVLLFSLLAERSFAMNCDSDDRVDTNLLANAYSEAVKSFPLPSIESNEEQAARTFKEAYNKAVADYGSTLTIDVYNQASKMSNELIDAVRKLTDKLLKSIEFIKKHNADPACLDNDLKELIKQLKLFLACLPGNVQIKRQALPDLPAQRTDIKSRTEDHSMAELFLDLSKNIDENVNSMFSFISNMYLVGWREARLFFNEMQTQIRNEFLNGPMMDTCRDAVEKISKYSQFIQSQVDKRTWDSFEDIAARINTISDDYNASRKNKCN